MEALLAYMGNLVSLYGSTFHVTPVDLRIIFQCNLYISCIMSCGNKIASNCFKLFQIVSNCSKLFQIVSNCFKLFQIVPNCFKLFQIVPNCSKLFQIVSNCFKLFHNYLLYDLNVNKLSVGAALTVMVLP